MTPTVPVNAPSGDYVVEARVSVNTPPSGMGKNYVQGGLVIYGDDGHYVKLASSSIYETRQTELNDAEQLRLKQGIERARRGLRERLRSDHG